MLYPKEVNGMLYPKKKNTHTKRQKMTGFISLVLSVRSKLSAKEEGWSGVMLESYK